MASASYTEDLLCSICLTIFTDPVTLLCGHSFCRQCITETLTTQHQCPQCPQCRTAIPAEGTCLPTSHILKSLAEKAKETERMRREHGHEKAKVVELCPEHEEKLKLFCVTDQQLACIICRDGEQHEGHMFKPIKEAAASLRKELEMGLQSLCDDIHATESLADTQRGEITKTKERSQQLKAQICRQFEEMHQFLRKRQDEIKNDLKQKEEEAVEKMSQALNAMETALSESRELERKATSVLEITDSERFLKSWTENNSMMTPEHLFRPRASEVQEVKTSLSLGPYESHLQFFMWKEMLQVIQPRAEELSLKSESANITVSDDGRSLFCTPKSKQPQSDPLFTFASTQGFDQTTTTTTPSFSFFTGFEKNPPPPLFSSSNLFGQNTTQPSFGSSFSFGQTTTTPSFDFSTGSDQASTLSFDTGLHTNLEKSKDTSFLSSLSTQYAFSINEFSLGQHYWEIDVGCRDYWELGIKGNFLKYDGHGYSACGPKITTELSFADRPRKIGIYINCSAKRLSFYDADNMTLIHTMSASVLSMPLSAYFNIRYRAPDPNPMTVCWY